MSNIEESIEVQPLDNYDETEPQQVNNVDLLDIKAPPPPPIEPKIKPKAKPKAKGGPPKTEIAVEPVQSNTVHFSIEQPEVAPPTKPVRMVRRRQPPQPEQLQPQPVPLQVQVRAPPTQNLPASTSMMNITPEQIHMYLANQRAQKAQRKNAKIQSLVAHALQ